MVLRLVLWPAGLALGAVSLAFAREEPAFSFAGSSLGGAAALLGAGWALLFCGLVFWGRRPASTVGPLLVAAGCAWFLAEWDNPGVGSAAAFTIGLVLFVACAPLAAWAMLAYPGGRLGFGVERVAVAVALAGAVLVLGLLPALFYDPATFGCGRCPDNLLLVSDDPGRVDDLNVLGVRLGLAWSLLLIAVAAWRLARSSRTRRRVVAPVVLAGCAYLGLVAGSFATSLDRGFLGSGELDRRLWLGQAAALAALAAAVAWGLLRARRTRSSLARLVVELGESASGGLRDGLADALADPDLELAYPVGEGRYADALGRAVDPAPLDGRAVTPLVREGRPVALLVHRADLLDNPELVEEVTSAARLALENERLQAEARAQLEDLRSSRARIIEAGDAERRRLERDLHDGAQQRLVGLSLALRLARSRLGPEHEEQFARLDIAETELHEAVTELRELAHGIHPAVLSDEGLAAAIEALAEGAPAPLRLIALPEERFPAAVETAAYLVVAEAAKAGPVTVAVARRDGALVVDVEAEAEPEGLLDLEDRVGALDGRLDVEHASDGGVRIRAEIPCG